MQKSDILLIAGKGHENYQIIGDQTIYFDDMLIAKRELFAKYHKDKSI
jgi:UDP-N-acetylmuramoyl-L-alanyl-D-glutamate--2,6-diaminopimelate ligase